MAIAYEESKQVRSNKVGAMVLKIFNQQEHSIVLIGEYHEFIGGTNSLRNNDYILKECKLAESSKKIGITQKSVFCFMKDETFKSACKTNV